jgi:hypothetical protein
MLVIKGLGNKDTQKEETKTYPKILNKRALLLTFWYDFLPDFRHVFMYVQFCVYLIALKYHFQT